MATNLEQTVLKNLLTNEKYMRKVLPFIKPDYFEGVYRILFKEVGKFVAKYNKLPSAESFKIELDQSDKLTDDQYNMAMDIVPQLFTKKGMSEISAKTGFKIVKQGKTSNYFSLSMVTSFFGLNIEFAKNINVKLPLGNMFYILQKC